MTFITITFFANSAFRSRLLWAHINSRDIGLISSLLLLVAADVAEDVGDVLVVFFLVGDDGGIVIIVVFNGLVDLDIVFRFGNDGLDLAGVLLGVGFLHQLFSLDGLR